VTQDDLLYRFRPRVFAIAAEFGTVRAACRAMGIHPWTYYRWPQAAAAPPRPGDPGASPCRNVPLPKIEREEMRFLTPAEILDLAEAIHARYRALVFVGAYGTCGSGAGRAPPKPGRSAGRGGHRGRDPHRGQGQADRRPAEDACRPPNRRAAALRRP
jgi:hypothetical protein